MTTAPRSNPTISQTENVREATLAPGAARDETYLKVAEVAQRLRVTPMTIYRAIDDGDFPGTVRIRGSIRVPVAAYEAYVAGSVVVSTEVLALAPDDVQALLDSMEGNDHCTIGYQIRIRAVLGAIEAFAKGGGLLVRRHSA